MAGPGEGYTIGYYGRPFEARNKVKGGAFTGRVLAFFDCHTLSVTPARMDSSPGTSQTAAGAHSLCPRMLRPVPNNHTSTHMPNNFTPNNLLHCTTRPCTPRFNKVIDGLWYQSDE